MRMSNRDEEMENYPDHRQNSVGGIIILIRFQIFPHHICVVVAVVLVEFLC